MTLQQLEYALAVDQYKNFTKAAEHCFVTQATLSAMVKKLEEEWEVVLFDRKTSPVITTDEGKQLLDDARLLVQQSKQLREKVGGLKGKIEGVVFLGVIPTIANALLPLMLPALLEQFPALKFHIKELTTEQIIEQLKSGRLDAGIVATPLPKSELEERVLYYESLLVYGRQAGDKTYLMPEDIQKSDIWMLEEGHCLREQFINLCALQKHKLRPGKLQFEASSFETLLGMIDVFGGLTLIPELYYRLLPPLKQEKVAYFSKPYPVREVSLVYYRPFAKAKTLEALAQAIEAAVQPFLMSAAYKKHELLIADI